MKKPTNSGDLIEDFPTVVYARRARPTLVTRTIPDAPKWTLERKLVAVNLALALAVLLEWFVL